MDGPTFDAFSTWPRLRLSFVAMTAPPSIWVHGFSAENDNAARPGHQTKASLVRALVVPPSPPKRPA